MFRLDELEFKAIDKPVFLRAHNEAGKLHGGPSYSAHELKNLYDLPRSSENDEGSGLKDFRYLVTEEGEHRFAREGSPSRHIPAHKEMPRTSGDGCLYACNMAVNKENEIIKFNNKSSNYQAGQNLIQFGIISLRLLTLNHPGMKMGARIEIEVIKHDALKAEDTFKSYFVTREAFNKLADEMIAHYSKLAAFQDTYEKFIFSYDDEKVNSLKAAYPVVASQATQLSPFLLMSGAQTNAPRAGIFSHFNFGSMLTSSSELKEAPARPILPLSAPQLSSSLFHAFINNGTGAPTVSSELLLPPSNFPTTPISPNKRKYSFMTPPRAPKKEEAKAESSSESSPVIAPPPSPLFFSSGESPTTPPSRRTKLDPVLLKEIFENANKLSQ